ncbi:hypothetical protein [Phormidium tenue]|uniref:hypothetical protein n=1 Tax=Phormidium tenue TaxID=126344 RepID=UPI0015C524F6|nr:hypothetical protein [Phormidium tenue]MBD2232084.1 hypothetical protein [Phormidium tenue FACHB-1052]
MFCVKLSDEGILGDRLFSRLFRVLAGDACELAKTAHGMPSFAVAGTFTWNN